MANQELNVVTGAYGFTGKAITQLLLSSEKRVLTPTAKKNAMMAYVMLPSILTTPTP